MSRNELASAVEALRKATAHVTWLQWGAIFTFPASHGPAWSIVDPEALLLVSLALEEQEPRLWSVTAMWARYGARLLSVQRAKNLITRFPPGVREGLGEFARLAVEAGDSRWRPMARRS